MNDSIEIQCGHKHISAHSYDDGDFEIEIENSNFPDCYFFLNQEEAKQLIEFLSKHIKK